MEVVERKEGYRVCEDYLGHDQGNLDFYEDLRERIINHEETIRRVIEEYGIGN